MAAALVTLAMSTLFGLLPLYGTKIVFDSVLRTQPLPREAAWVSLPSDPRRLLATVAVAMVSLAVVSAW